MARFEMLVGSGDFWARAALDVAAARRRVLIQAMTFEGDAAGLGVAHAIRASTAEDRRVLVDDYTRNVLNDTFLVLSRDPALAAEARTTWAMFDELKQNGVGVRITNPVGHNPFRYPVRNHKKLLVMDDVAWLGGINFSDHNFAWHDLMVRIEDRGIVDWLAEQFERDWQGTPRPAEARFDGIKLLSLDGTDNARQLDPLLARIGAATRSLEMVSAYATFPFVDALAAAARRGVSAALYTPRENNKPIVRDYLCGIAESSGLRICLTPGMTHAKALLVDGRVLVLGSCNFEFVSYRTNSEFVAVIEDAALIADFEARLLAPMRANSHVACAADVPAWRRRGARMALKVADRALARLKPGPRVTEWCAPR
ncbi:MAG TPA: phosphatidylserine/phosphatidylglycerophosphate/cardiolipin synthase family protein [Sphingomonadaceae bacterium]